MWTGYQRKNTIKNSKKREMKKLCLLLSLVVLAVVCNGQQSPKFEYDTLKGSDGKVGKTLIQWVDDVKTGHISSGYATRVTKYQIQYQITDTAQIGEEEVKAKKTKIPVEAIHYRVLPMTNGKDRTDYSDRLKNVVQDYNYDPSASK